MSVMKEHAVIINTSHGGIIDERALFTRLEISQNNYSILDIREKEPPDSDDPLGLLPNVILTPHIAGITHESSQRVAELIFEEVDRVFMGQPALTAIV